MNNSYSQIEQEQNRGLIGKTIGLVIALLFAMLILSGCETTKTPLKSQTIVKDLSGTVQAKKKFKPVRVLRLEGPSLVFAGKAALFTADVNLEVASLPLTFDWIFEDGTKAKGLSATHTFQEPGTYYVRFSATNKGSIATDSIRVWVREPDFLIGHLVSGH